MYLFKKIFGVEEQLCNIGCMEMEWFFGGDFLTFLHPRGDSLNKQKKIDNKISYCLEIT